MIKAQGRKPTSIYLKAFIVALYTKASSLNTLSRAHGQYLQARMGRQVKSEVGSPPSDFSSLFEVEQTGRERKHFT